MASKTSIPPKGRLSLYDFMKQPQRTLCYVISSLIFAAVTYLSFTPELLGLASVPDNPIAPGRNCWLSTEGAGEKNGSGPENAYGPEKAQQCWEETGAEGTMYVMPGNYSKNDKKFWSLRIEAVHSGKSGHALKRLKGIGEVRLSGSRPVPYQRALASRGETWIHLQKDAVNIAIENFKVEKVARGIVAGHGGNKNLYLRDLDFQDTRQNIILQGHPRCLKLSECSLTEDELSSHVVISRVTGRRYSKRHVRLGKGIHHVDVFDSHADAENLDGDFAVGFDVEGPAHDILFYGSSSRRNIYTLSEYWNGDGFKAELETFAIRWIDCEAYENADGGFDIKTKGALLTGITALRNKRNIRSWSSEGVWLENVYAADSVNAGGIGSDSGLWTQGKLECRFCTVENNAIQALVEGTAPKAGVTFYDSIVSTGNRPEAKVMHTEGKAKVAFVRTEILKNRRKDERNGSATKSKGYDRNRSQGLSLSPEMRSAGSWLYEMISTLEKNAE